MIINCFFNKKNSAWRGVCDNGFEVFLANLVCGKRNN